MADRIEHGGTATGCDAEPGHLRDGLVFVDHLVLVVELDQAHPAFARLRALVGDEGVEPALGVAADGFHGTGAIDDRLDDGEVGVCHCASWNRME